MKKSKLKKDLKVLRICYFSIAIVFFLYMMSTSYLIYNLSSEQVHIPKIIYENLTEAQIIKIQGILDDVDSFCLNSAKKITFSGNSEELEENIGGSNFLGYITIIYDENEDILRNRIGHELIHNFSIREDIAYKLGDELYCFE